MVDLDIDKISYFKARSLPSSPVSSSVPPAAGNSAALTPDYLSFRNTWWGQPQPVSYKLIWKAYLEDPIIRQCVDTIVDAIVGDGYIIEGKTQAHVKRVWKVFKNSDFQKILQDMVSSLMIFGDAYAERIFSSSGALEYLRPVDTASMRIDCDEHGREFMYIQRVLHRRVNFYPDEMVHFSINSIGGRVYGITSLQSVINTVRTKFCAQNYNTEYFRRPGLPRSLYISKNLSKAQNDRIISELKKATPQTDIWINAGMGEVSHAQVAPSNQDMQFVELMNFLRQEIIAAMGVPPVFLGITEGSNRSSSQTQLEAWDRKKKKMRLMIQDIVNQHILNTPNFGFDDVYFKFNDENSRERLKYGQLAQLLSTIDYVTPNQLLDIVNLPPLEDKKIRFDSFTGEIDKKRNIVGDTPVYLLRQQQEAQANLNNPNIANPKRNQDKVDNAERLNSPQANESRKYFFKSDDYTYGAVDHPAETTDKNSWRQMEDRIRRNVEAMERVMENRSVEFEQMDAMFGPKKTRIDKAVFYRGSNQLEE